MRCDVSVITTVVKLLTDHPEIKLWQIWPRDESFKLRRREVPRDEIEAVGVREPAFLLFKDVVFSTNDEEQPPEVEGGEDIPAVEGRSEPRPLCNEDARSGASESNFSLTGLSAS